MIDPKPTTQPTHRTPMNNTEHTEPLAAIIAEMRRRSDEAYKGQFDNHVDCVRDQIELDEIDDWSDRIEAAAERMRESYCELCQEKDAAYDRLLLERDAAIKATAPGNAAAMRAALEKIARWDHGIGADISNIARAALAAPSRNCDRPECATAKGAIAALHANPCANHDFCKEQVDCAECATRWLVAPAAEGGAK